MRSVEEVKLSLTELILRYMKDHGIASGADCPVLKITAEPAEKGKTKVSIRAATEREVASMVALGPDAALVNLNPGKVN
jgi:hypothetical protein